MIRIFFKVESDMWIMYKIDMNKEEKKSQQRTSQISLFFIEETDFDIVEFDGTIGCHLQIKIKILFIPIRDYDIYVKL